MLTQKSCVAWLVVGLFAAVGCQKKEAPPAEEKAEAPAVSTAKSPMVPDQEFEQQIEALAAVIDMPEDYITAAEEEIKDENLTSELEKLEKELAEEEKANPTPTPAKPAATSK